MPPVPAEKFGKYSLLHKLATGGMGEVWLARQSGPAGFDRFIAVKRLLPNLAENNEFVQMFLDEARLAARLTHPNICQVYEFGREGGSYYLAMEYMHGESLSSMLERSIKERKPLSQPVVAMIIQQALEGLHFAHEAKDEQGRPLNLVHRDISPSNIFVTYDGQVKLLDFGIAKAAHRITQTVAGSIKGKFGYIAPEVYKGMTIDRRVDLFAMGVVLWEMLTRRRLYKRAAEYEILRAIVEEEPPDPRTLDSSISQELAQTALKALAKLPGERYQTALEMRRAVSSFLRSLRDEMDAQALAEVMVQLYGQVWIDLRSSVLESFKESAGSVVNAEALNPTRTNSQISQITDAQAVIPGADFSQQVQPVAPVRSPSRVGSRPNISNRLPTPLPPMAPPPQTHSGLLIGLGSVVTLIALVSVAAFAAWKHKVPDPLPAEPTDPVALRNDVVPPSPPVPNVAANPQQEARVAPPPKAFGTLTVTATPRSALVQLDDGEDRSVPWTYKDLQPGTRHHVVVHSPGYELKTYDFEATGANTNWTTDLLPRPKVPRVGKTPTHVATPRPEGNSNPDEMMDPFKK